MKLLVLLLIFLCSINARLLRNAIDEDTLLFHDSHDSSADATCRYEDLRSTSNNLIRQIINVGLAFNEKSKILYHVLNLLNLKKLASLLPAVSYKQIETIFGAFPEDANYEISNVQFLTKTPYFQMLPIKDVGSKYARIETYGGDIEFRALLTISTSTHVPTDYEVSTWWWYRLMTLIYRVANKLLSAGYGHPTENANHKAKKTSVWIRANVTAFEFNTTLDAYVLHAPWYKYPFLGADVATLAMQRYGPSGVKYAAEKTISRVLPTFVNSVAGSVFDYTSTLAMGAVRGVTRGVNHVAGVPPFLEMIAGLRVRDSTLDLGEFNIGLEPYKDDGMGNGPLEKLVNAALRTTNYARSIDPRSKRHLENALGRALEHIINDIVINAMKPGFSRETRGKL